MHNGQRINGKNMDQHDLLREHTRMLIKENISSLIVRGSHGLGKSYTVLKELDNAGLKEGVNYLVVTGFSTPLKLFETLARTATLERPKLLVFDDVDSLLSSKISVSLLKAGLWPPRGSQGRRIITYNSNSSQVQGPTSINFEGRILLILNDQKQEKILGRPVFDRCTTFDLSMSNGQLIKYIDLILPNIQTPLPVETRKQIWQKIKIFSGNSRFSLRALVRSFEFYQYDKSKWFPMFLSSLNLSDEQKIFYEITLSDKNITARDKAKKFAKLTGKSTRAYYRVAKK